MNGTELVLLNEPRCFAEGFLRRYSQLSHAPKASEEAHMKTDANLCNYTSVFLVRLQTFLKPACSGCILRAGLRSRNS